MFFFGMQKVFSLMLSHLFFAFVVKFKKKIIAKTDVKFITYVPSKHFYGFRFYIQLQVIFC